MRVHCFPAVLHEHQGHLGSVTLCSHCEQGVFLWHFGPRAVRNNFFTGNHWGLFREGAHLPKFLDLKASGINTKKKFTLNLQLQTIQILTNDVQVLILCLSYFITTVKSIRIRNVLSYFFLSFICRLQPVWCYMYYI